MPTGLDAVLAELLARLHALRGEAVDVSAAELRGWPADAVAALHAAGLLVPGPPAQSIVCDGCEEACVRPVRVLPNGNGESVAFVMCHLRDDIDRVPVELADLTQWRLTRQSLADGLAGLLGGSAANAHGSAAGHLRLGFALGKREGRDVLYLRCDGEGPRLLLAGHVLEVPDALVLRDGRLAFDLRLLARCVDAPVEGGAALPAESHEVVGKRMLARKRELLAAKKRAFLKVIATEEDCSVSWVKQLIAKAEAPNPFAGLGAQAAPGRTVSTRKKRAK